MHGLALVYVMRELPGIESFRIVQESRTLTRVLLVPGTRFDRALPRRSSRGSGAVSGPTLKSAWSRWSRCRRSGPARCATS